MINSEKRVTTKKEIQEWLLFHLEANLNIDAALLDLYKPFFDFGLSSVLAVEISGDLEKKLGIQLSPVLFYQYSNIATLSEYLASQVLKSVENIRQEVDGIPDDSFLLNAFANNGFSPEADTKYGDAIAIVGMACRFPGAVDPESFWELLRSGKSGIRKLPEGRWRGMDNLEQWDAISLGGFLDTVDEFDAGFFSITPREAMYIDPQQRLLLEVSWEALENAGIPAESIRGKDVGVFIGISSNDYARLQGGDISNLSTWSGTGNSLSIASNRISYFLDLKGPSMSIDTACSSSLVAAHEAVQSILQGECEMAMAGGVNLLLNPDLSVIFAKAGMLSPDGQCKTFDAMANGYVRGEGCGVIVLKKLSKALADKNNILALVRGSAVNHGGSSNGITAPNGLAQARVIRSAIKKAKVHPGQIGFIETHGTGTTLGDPIEVEALVSVFEKETSTLQPCYLGAVKTNIGHLESAAGIAGIIKTILVLLNKEIPRNLNFQELNSKIPASSKYLRLATEHIPWNQTEGAPRIAGVSSFGFGGTNAHLILEGFEYSEMPTASLERPLHLLTASAETEEALRDLCNKYSARLRQAPATPDFFFSANTGRSLFQHRLALKADTQNAARLLQEFASAKNPNEIITAHLKHPHAPVIVFLFTGQGAQYQGMAKELYDTQPVFRKTLDSCFKIYHDLTGTSLSQILFGEDREELINNTVFTQPAVFSIGYSLASLLDGWGIHPSFVMGHSLGEYIAACFSGVFSLEEGMKFVARRASLMNGLSSPGKMLLVVSSAQRVKALIQDYGGRVAIASLNGPDNIVISGEAEAIDKITEECAGQHIRTSGLTVSHAFHSPMMNSVLNDFRLLARSIRFENPRIPLISNLLARAVGEEMKLPEYWVKHLIRPVNFIQGMKVLEELNVEVFIEIGPAPNLLAMGMACVEDKNKLWLPTLRRNQSNWDTILSLLSQLFLRGVNINWEKFDEGYCRRRVPVPGYLLQRQKFWIESPNKNSQLVPSGQRHPLLGNKIDTAAFSEGEILYEGMISAIRPAFLRDHKIFQKAVLPASGYIEMVLAAGVQAFTKSKLHLKNIRFLKAMLLDDQKELKVQLFMRPAGEDQYDFKIFGFNENSSDNSPWSLHAIGLVGVATPNDAGAETEVPLLVDPVDFSVDTHYANYFRIGMEYGPSFRAIEQLWLSGQQVMGRVWLPQSISKTIADYHFHPVMLDASMQVIAAAAWGVESRDAYLPVSIDSFDFFSKPGTELLSCATIKSAVSKDVPLITSDFDFFDIDGNLVASMKGLTLKRTNPAALQQKEGWEKYLYQPIWQKFEPFTTNKDTKVPGGSWWIFSKGQESRDAIEEMVESGEPFMVIEPGEGFQKYSASCWSLDPSDRFQLQLLFKEAPFFPANILYLWGIEPNASNEPDTGILTETTGKVLMPFIEIAQHCAAMSGTHQKPAFWVFTRGSVPAGLNSELPAITMAPLWGIFRSLNMEMPGFVGAIVDLDPAQPLPAFNELLTIGASQAPEKEFAIRNGAVWKSRIVPAETNTNRAVEIVPDSTYLITGGLGALGLHMAKWLIDQGAKYLLLIGRQEPDEAVSHTLVGLQSSGAKIRTVSADITRQADVNALFMNYEDWPQVKGVIHAAGLSGFHPLNEINRENFASVLSPKVNGSWCLHQATRSLDLDFFFTFSSIASVWGSKGQIHYSAANSFLDALAWRRRDLRLPCQAINWGPWEGGGMMGKDQETMLSRIGLNPLTPHVATRAFNSLLGADLRQVIVANVDWLQLKELFKTAGADRQLDLIPLPETNVTGPNTKGKDLLERLTNSEEGTRHVLLTTYLQQVTSHIFRMDPERVDVNQYLTNMGLDSLMALEIKRMIYMDLGIDIDPIRFLQDLTLHQLALDLIVSLPELIHINKMQEGNLSNNNPGNIPPPVTAVMTPQRARALLENIENYSEKEIDELLAIMSSEDY